MVQQKYPLSLFAIAIGTAAVLSIVVVSATLCVPLDVEIKGVRVRVGIAPACSAQQ